eukprot:9466984-Pyramimonas_sp.AAC.1
MARAPSASTSAGKPCASLKSHLGLLEAHRLHRVVPGLVRAERLLLRVSHVGAVETFSKFLLEITWYPAKASV